MPKLILDLTSAKEFIKEQNAKTVIVQIPEGFKNKATGIADEIQEVCETVFVKMDPCFGACDLPLKDKEVLDADVIIHIGHSAIHKDKTIFYVPCYYEMEKKEIEENVSRLIKELEKQKINSIALVANTQYYHFLPDLKKMLFEKKIYSFYGKGSQRVPLEGQILGCNYTSIKSIMPNVQATVYFGDGYFHPLGIIFSTNKPVFIVNPINKKIEELGEKTRDKFMRKRFAAIALASEAKTFGILVSTKSGQRQKEKALELKKAIERKNKKVYLFEMDLIDENYLIGVNVDCLVNTACNRLVLDDGQNWKKILINPTECLIAIGELKWEQWKPDEFVH